MIKVVAHLYIRPESIEQAAPLFKELVTSTRQEQANISYELFVDQKDSGHFVFVEEWPDQAALDAHCATEHFQRLFPQIGQYSRQDGNIVVLSPFPGV